MLEKPQLEDHRIIAGLEQQYNLDIRSIHFLPLGADLNTAVYRITTRNSLAYFLKLRNGPFLESSVSVPTYLSDNGLQEIIPALPTTSGRLWATLDPYRVILYPFIEGQDGFDRPLSA
ncbi:MAG: hypothetical protein R3293_26375, partial [Candidatus Promineifilaceae bacterium]|nr:hypothetical protein [Candidatus Promineifilaceae bacterium]